MSSLRFAAVLALAMLAFTLSCGRAPRTLEFDGFSIHSNPEEAPSLVPSAFVYPGARVVQSAVYERDPYLSNSEGMVLLETDDPADKLLGYYAEAFRKNGWQVIQSHLKPGEYQLIAESPSRRLATLILRGESPVQIKLYLRQASLL
jgi:hypothetical protein